MNCFMLVLGPEFRPPSAEPYLQLLGITAKHSNCCLFSLISGSKKKKDANPKGNTKLRGKRETEEGEGRVTESDAITLSYSACTEVS